MYVFKEELAEEKFIVVDPTTISETNKMDLFQNDSPGSFLFSFNSGEELTGAFVDEKNPENPSLDCDLEASNDSQDQGDETGDRIYGDDEAINEGNYENSENLETENNDNDDIDNNDNTSTIAADVVRVVDHNAAYMEPETLGIFVFTTRT